MDLDALLGEFRSGVYDVTLNFNKHLSVNYSKSKSSSYSNSSLNFGGKDDVLVIPLTTNGFKGFKNIDYFRKNPCELMNSLIDDGSNCKLRNQIVCQAEGICDVAFENRKDLIKNLCSDISGFLGTCLECEVIACFEENIEEFSNLRLYSEKTSLFGYELRPFKEGNFFEYAKSFFDFGKASDVRKDYLKDARRSYLSWKLLELVYSEINAEFISDHSFLKKNGDFVLSTSAKEIYNYNSKIIQKIRTGNAVLYSILKETELNCKDQGIILDEDIDKLTNEVVSCII